ncbi:Hypothetical protein CINCED_3A008815 [Cinara cedri]|uniref:Uncharacterized protein n=1 Tax=Cinara cedri TaxID=506608 RepID=A0A5E4LX91_9HEMI|nr:Hypothetical protein CINCED_3A008815 [Cinara cedri]
MISVDNYLVERYPNSVSEGPFYNSTVGIRFPLTKEWMESNKNKQMDIMCTAKVANAQELINKMNVLLQHDSDQTLSQKRQIFNAVLRCFVDIVISNGNAGTMPLYPQETEVTEGTVKLKKTKTKLTYKR